MNILDNLIRKVMKLILSGADPLLRTDFFLEGASLKRDNKILLQTDQFLPTSNKYKVIIGTILNKVDTYIELSTDHNRLYNINKFGSVLKMAEVGDTIIIEERDGFVTNAKLSNVKLPNIGTNKSFGEIEDVLRSDDNTGIKLVKDTNYYNTSLLKKELLLELNSFRIFNRKAAILYLDNGPMKYIVGIHLA